MRNYLLMRFTIISYSNIKEKYSCLENLKVRLAPADEKIPVSDPTFQRVNKNGLQLQTRETPGQMGTETFPVTPENMRSSFAITYTLPILFLSARLVICLNSTSSRNQTQVHSYDTDTSSMYKQLISIHFKTKSGIYTARHIQKKINEPCSGYLRWGKPSTDENVQKNSLHDMSHFRLPLAFRCVLQSLSVRSIHC